jgi:hypothetical protein
MSSREDYPAGVPCWVDTNQPDPVDAARFYSGLFGWQTEDAMPPGAGTHYYMARIWGAPRFPDRRSFRIPYRKGISRGGED